MWKTLFYSFIVVKRVEPAVNCDKPESRADVRFHPGSVHAEGVALIAVFLYCLSFHCSVSPSQLVWWHLKPRGKWIQGGMSVIFLFLCIFYAYWLVCSYLCNHCIIVCPTLQSHGVMQTNKELPQMPCPPSSVIIQHAWHSCSKEWQGDCYCALSATYLYSSHTHKHTHTQAF